MFGNLFAKARLLTAGVRPAVLAAVAGAVVGLPLAASAWQGPEWNTGLRWDDGREVQWRSARALGCDGSNVELRLVNNSQSSGFATLKEITFNCVRGTAPAITPERAIGQISPGGSYGVAPISCACAETRRREGHHVCRHRHRAPGPRLRNARQWLHLHRRLRQRTAPRQGRLCLPERLYLRRQLHDGPDQWLRLGDAAHRRALRGRLRERRSRRQGPHRLHRWLDLRGRLCRRQAQRLRHAEILRRQRLYRRVEERPARRPGRLHHRRPAMDV